MKAVTLATWNDKSLETNNFEIITKVTDLGSPDGKKSLLCFYMNYYQKDAISSTFIPNHSISINYKTESKPSFSTLCHFTAAQNNFRSGNREHKQMLSTPVSGIMTVQLQIKGFTRGEFSINDFGLIYRTHRDSSVQEHDEG